MRPTRHRITLGGLAVMATLFSAAPVTAHDFGPLSINLYSRLAVDEDRIRVRWVLDMAEIPAAAIVKLIDRDADGSVSEDEKAAYLETWTSSVLGQIQLTIGGAELPKTVTATQLDLPTGENRAVYLRVVLDLTIDLPPAPADGDFNATYHDLNYEDYIGWREVVVEAGEGAELVSSTVPTDDRTAELQTYPPDLWASAPNSEADFSFRVGGAGAGTGADGDRTRGTEDESSAVTDDMLAIGLLVLVLVVVIGAVVGGLATAGTARRARR